MLAARLSRPVGHPLLSKRPIARNAIPKPLRQRAFHASAPRQNAVYDALLSVPHEVFQILHNTVGLPWYATIPAAALLFRFLLVGTVGAYVRGQTSRYIALNPLRYAMFRAAQEQARRTSTSPAQAEKTARKAFRAQTKELDKRWDCSVTKQISWTVFQVPIFLANAEVIRQMAGTQSGLLQMGINAVGLGKQSAAASTSSTTEHGKDVAVDPGFEAAVGSGIDSSDTTTSIITQHSRDVASNPWFEPSLSDGGFLWFTDLTAADPMHALPFIVSALMFANVSMSNNIEDGRKMKGFRRGMQLVALLIGPLTQQVPTGLLYWWACSTTSVMLSNAWLDWRHPIVRGFGPCKRPLQRVMTPRTVPKARLVRP